MEIDHWLRRSAGAFPERAAISAAAGELSYRELRERASAAAAELRERGARPGEPVAIALPPGLDFAVALHACLLLGAPALPLDPRLSEAERQRRASAASLVIDELATPDDGWAIDEGPVRADAVATVMHTSGTTSEPRQVDLTYGNWQANAAGSALALGLDPEERWLCALPLAHVGGLSILIRSAVYGTTVVLHERFATEAVLAALREQRITLASLVPTMLARLLDAGLEGTSSVRAVLLGGAGASPALIDRALAAGIPVRPTYGMTEACSQIATAAPGDPHGGGVPLLGARIAIGADGEVLVAGPMVAPAALDGQGWLATGDLGALDERGRLRIVGRKADTIVSGGENVAPAEVEAVLLEHPAIADVGVHARPDAEWGEAVVATVVLRAGAETAAEELQAHCRAALAGFKVPKEFRFADALPRSATGKLLRREL